MMFKNKVFVKTLDGWWLVFGMYQGILNGYPVEVHFDGQFFYKKGNK